MSANVDGKLPGKATIFIENQLKGMGENSYELDHLERCQMLLPPEVLLVLGSHCRHHVVEVHDDMNEGVEESKEGGVASGQKSGSNPHGTGHDSMMNYMQERDLVELFACDETKCVNKFREFAEVVHVTTMKHQESFWAVGSIHGLTS